MSEKNKQPSEQSAEGRSLTLYEVETELADAFDEWLTLKESEPETDSDSALAEVLNAYAVAAREKRDRLARFATHLESQSALAASEIKRLQDRKKRFDSSRRRLLAYCDYVMQSQGVSKLEGEQFSIKRRKCPASVEVTDQQEVPAQFLTRTETWSVDKKAVKDEYKNMKACGIEENNAVPGTRLVNDKHKVVIE